MGHRVPRPPPRRGHRRPCHLRRPHHRDRHQVLPSTHQQNRHPSQTSQLNTMGLSVLKDAGGQRLPYPGGCRILLKNGGRFFSSSWRIRKPHGCAEYLHRAVSRGRRPSADQTLIEPGLPSRTPSGLLAAPCAPGEHLWAARSRAPALAAACDRYIQRT
jgi:hypothetical protein